MYDKVYHINLQSTELNWTDDAKQLKVWDVLKNACLVIV